MSDNSYSVRVYKGQIVEFRSSKEKQLLDLGYYDKKTDAEREVDTTYLPVGSILTLTLKFDYANRTTSGVQFVFKDENGFSYDVLFSDLDDVVKNMSFGVIQGQFELVKKGCAYGIKFIN